jgi:hypothetical protein
MALLLRQGFWPAAVFLRFQAVRSFARVVADTL